MAMEEEEEHESQIFLAVLRSLEEVPAIIS